MTAPFWFLPDGGGADDVNHSGRGRGFDRRDEAAHSAAGPMGEDDRALVARIGAGDSAAFEVLFRTYYKDLHRYATSLTRNSAIAEELVADMFVSVWERRTHWLVRESIRAHLFAAVRHRVLHWHRRTRVEERYAARVVETLAMDVTVGVSVEQEVEWGDVVRVIREAIAKLPSRTREAYVLHRQDEMTYQEVAQVMGVSVKTVEKQIAVALRTLRAALTVLKE